MTEQNFTSVWDALEDSPAQAENMKLRSRLMIAIKTCIQQAGWTQTQAAELMGVTQPRVSDLVRGHIELFSLDILMNMAASGGLHLDVRVTEDA
jgi:predicted XRE-type DNA-binding protein